MCKTVVALNRRRQNNDKADMLEKPRSSKKLKKPEKPKPIYVPNLKKVQCSAYVYDKNTKHNVQCEKTTMIENNTSNQNLTWYCEEHWQQLQKGLKFHSEKEAEETTEEEKKVN